MFKSGCKIKKSIGSWLKKFRALNGWFFYIDLLTSNSFFARTHFETV